MYWINFCARFGSVSVYEYEFAAMVSAIMIAEFTVFVSIFNLCSFVSVDPGCGYRSIF